MIATTPDDALRCAELTPDQALQLANQIIREIEEGQGRTALSLNAIVRNLGVMARSYIALHARTQWQPIDDAAIAEAKQTHILIARFDKKFPMYSAVMYDEENPEFPWLPDDGEAYNKGYPTHWQHIVPPDRLTSPASAASGWQPIETAPKGRKLLLYYTQSNGVGRTITGQYYLAGTLDWHDDAETNGDDYAPEGWYEAVETHEDIQPTESPPTHWMPLPAPPGITSAAPEADDEDEDSAGDPHRYLENRDEPVEPAPARVAELLYEALEFYADPNTWFATALMCDRPCGAIETDISSTEGWESLVSERPGKRARETLTEADRLAGGAK